MQTSCFWIELYRRWRDDDDATGRGQLQGCIKKFLKYESFQSALVLDEKGEHLWSSYGAPIAIDPAQRDAARKAAHDNRVTHLGPTIILRIDPGDYPFPTLQTWTTLPILDSFPESHLVERSIIFSSYFFYTPKTRRPQKATEGHHHTEDQ